MKYIKTYEDINREPEVGDYVIIINPYFNKEIREFFEKNIGRIVKKEILNKSYGKVNFYDISYKNIPNVLVDHFEGDIFQAVEEIITYFGKTKKELKLKIAADKYNL